MIAMCTRPPEPANTEHLNVRKLPEPASFTALCPGARNHDRF